jgi:signal transduction histidine kinase
MQEAVSNLVKNALEHSPAHGRVTVHVESTNLFARFTVEDTGAGVRPEDLPRLFERFYQGRGARRTGGTGIGLALAKAIVERHGGFISADSAPDGGARFTVTLPRSLTNL